LMTMNSGVARCELFSEVYEMKERLGESRKRLFESPAQSVTWFEATLMTLVMLAITSAFYDNTISDLQFDQAAVRSTTDA
jgi:hypothetical protein